MKITQVVCKGVILQIGDIIVVKYKEILESGKEGTEIEKEIIIDSFKPYDDSSEDIWIVDPKGQVYADENFKCKCN